jgi:hypothetical protein
MIPTLSFYHLLLFALVWLFLLLYWLWPNDLAARGQANPTPTPPPRKRSKAPKPFAGLTHKPLCAACSQAATHPTPLPLVPPDPMPLSNRRPRQVDTSQHFCPHATCAYRGWVGVGNLRANFACRTPAYASHCRSRCRPRGQVWPKHGGRRRQRWRRA